METPIIRISCNPNKFLGPLRIRITRVLLYIYGLCHNLVEYDVISGYLFWDIEILPYDYHICQFSAAYDEYSNTAEICPNLNYYTSFWLNFENMKKN